MLYTIIQIIAFQALFLLVYDLFLKRETFFNYNRAYLLITSILSLVLPFIKFSELKTMTTKDLVIQLPEVFIGIKTPTDLDVLVAEQAGIIIEQPQMPLWQSTAIIGIVLASLIFLYKISKLYWLKHQNPKRWQDNVLIVRLMKSNAAFSFFNTIFLGERIPETEKKVIYKHELVHIKELHTLDLLFFEVLRIVFWFNPLVYIYQNRIKELHEYIADAKAVKQNGKANYYESLLNQIFDVNNVSFTNTFFKKSLIKKRIVMLQKTKSKQLHLIKYALLFPLVFGMLIYTSTEVRAQEKVQQEKVTDQELTDEELVKKYYDELVAMKRNGATFFKIAEYAGFGSMNLEKYLLSKEEFLKSKAYMQYVADDVVARKSENGTLTDQDMRTAENMILGKHKTYLDYKAWKFSEEGKEHWESFARDGVLRLFVNELGNQTDEEKKLLDGLLKQLKDKDYEKIIVTDGTSTLIIDDYEGPKSDEVIESVEVPFSVVEIAPTLIECKDLPTNAERKNCMNQFVNKHIAKNFNTGIADSLSPGRKRIFVSFRIDKEGFVKDADARAPSAALEEEAIRVIKTLPQFVPGKQKGKLVVVPFSIPIVFQVTNDNKEQETKSYEELVAQRDRILQNSSEKNPIVVNLNHQIDALKEKIENSLYLEKLKKREESLINEAFLNQIKKDSTQLDKIPFSVVEIAPVHPDCNSVSDVVEQKECTTYAINQYVGKNFNTSLGNSLGLPSGKKRIFTSFIIDKQGNVTGINARGPHPKLEEEAVRVIKLLPKFIPAKQDGKVVNAPYYLPIVFQTFGTKKE